MLTAMKFKVFHPRDLLVVGDSDEFRTRVSLLKLSLEWEIMISMTIYSCSQV